MGKGLPRKRRARRVKYEPSLVVQRVLANPLYLAVARVLLESPSPLQAGDIRRELVGRGVDISVGYVSSILKKLERWGVVRCYRSPANGRLLWVVRASEAARLVAEELRKREAQAVFEVLKLGDLGEGEEG